MTVKVTAYMATSLDGFIAREDGNLDWLSVVDAAIDYGYEAYMATIDVVVMGRKTFEKVLTFDEWPYTDKWVVVLSASLKPTDVPTHLGQKVEIYADTISKLLAFLANSGASCIYVDGAKVVQSFLKEGLLDEITITRLPVVLGAGIALFGGLSQDIKMQHIKTTAFESGAVQSMYRTIGRLS